MRSHVRRIATTLLLSAPAVAGAQSQPTRSIAVSGQAEVRVTPSTVNIVFGVETLDKELATAKTDNDRRVQAVMQSLQSLGIAPKDMQTDYIHVEPRYDEMNNGPVLRYYKVRKTISVTLTDVSKFERSLSGALQSGATHVMGVQFLTSELRKHRDEARARAIRAAREKAVALAGELNARVGKVVSIQEYGGGVPWHSYNAMWSGMGYGGAGMNQVSIQAGGNSNELLGDAIALGQIGISASVSVSFELEP